MQKTTEPIPFGRLTLAGPKDKVLDQSINFIDERVKTTTDIVTKINTNYATIKQTQQ